MQPAHGGTGGWHQDGSGAYDFGKLGYPVALIQLWVSFLLADQTRPGTGNMELIPGSHRSSVPLPADIRAARGDTPIGHVICAPTGSVLVFHNGVWHRTYRHDGDRDRFTAHYVYSPPWVRPADRFTNSGGFLERTTPMRGL
ncbi:phytanoyl-CoA dioxygenase family protein [Actinopolymorpha singaporensis]|uniref:phytanoyl-CoA dioxygenase family protein n=1 Tax=Actinopolymorpha singaporensis TaxID=117157 RepID=UPI0018D361A7|nr:phytanoyl-CoA dioxygenase family protein [Actinopolymorpha singaporensis]